MGFKRRLGLTLIELTLSVSIFLVLISTVLFVLLNPVKSTFARMQNTAREMRVSEALRQLQTDLFFAHAVKVLGKTLQGTTADGQGFSYEETDKGLKRTLGQSTQYFTLPEDPKIKLTFSLQNNALLKINYHNKVIFQKVNL